MKSFSPCKIGDDMVQTGNTFSTTQTSRFGDDIMLVPPPRIAGLETTLSKTGNIFSTTENSWFGNDIVQNGKYLFPTQNSWFGDEVAQNGKYKFFWVGKRYFLFLTGLGS